MCSPGRSEAESWDNRLRNLSPRRRAADQHIREQQRDMLRTSEGRIVRSVPRGTRIVCAGFEANRALLSSARV